MADLSLARASRHAIEPEDVFARRDMQDVAGLAGKQQMFRHGRQGASEETAWRRPASAAWHVATHSNGPHSGKSRSICPSGRWTGLRSRCPQSPRLQMASAPPLVSTGRRKPGSVIVMVACEGPSTAAHRPQPEQRLAL